MRDIQEAIKKSWNPPKLDYGDGNTITANVTFNIFKDGTVKNVKLIKESGIKDFDEEALKTIQEYCSFIKLLNTYLRDMIQ